MSYQPVDEPAIFTSAIDFISAISPTEFFERFQSQNFANWIFRGHGSNKFFLIPSSFRNKETQKNARSKTHDYNVQVSNEIGNIVSFLKHADRQGIKLAGDSINLREEISFLEAEKSCLEDGTKVYPLPLWPQKELLPIISIAQHYGIETRLLDWTKNPLTAAYFAATGNLFQNEECPDDIVVWALNIKNLYLINHRPIEFIEPPAGENPNLAAQQGVFTLFRSEKLIHRFSDNEKQKEQLPPNINRWGLEELLKEYGRSDSLAYQKEPLLIRFQLIKDEVAKLLELLFDMGVSAATLFPGFSGVARATKESNMLWDSNKSKTNMNALPSLNLRYQDNVHDPADGAIRIPYTSTLTEHIPASKASISDCPNVIEINKLIQEGKNENIDSSKRLDIARTLVGILENTHQAGYFQSVFYDVLYMINVLKNVLYPEIYDLLDIIKRLHNLDPANPKICLDMGRTYAHIANAEKAVQWYKRALKSAEDYKHYAIAGMACQCLSSIFFDHFNDKEKYKEYAAQGVFYFTTALTLNKEKENELALKCHLKCCCVRINDYKTLQQYGISDDI